MFDGRLTNYDKLKDLIIDKGYSFIDNSQAEIILFTYIEYGKYAIELLEGNFLLVIFNDSHIFLARDRLGTKPLYYTINNNFIFSDEIKSILSHDSVTAKIGKSELCEIFGLGPAHTPGKTFFKDIYEILPGHFAIYKSGEFETHKYWDLETSGLNDSQTETISRVYELVTNSLEKEIDNDKNVAAMLSGGLDSSILCALAKKINNNLRTFNIDFINNDNDFKANDYQPTRDSDFVKIMVDTLKTKHTTCLVSNEELFKTLKDAMLAREAPGMADVDSSMLVFLRKIKDSGVNTILSGECSDEIFGGYPWYYKEHLINTDGFPWSKSLKERESILNESLVSNSYLEQYVINALNSTSKEIVYNSEDCFENTFRRTCYNTIKWFMNTLVERTARMSKMVGVEVRMPFADYKIFEYVYNISAKYKLGLVNGNDIPVEKYLLRKAFENELPNEIVHRKKSPFPKTYDPRYLEMLENEIKNIINNSTSPILEIINVKYLYEMLDTHGENLNENWFGQLMTYPQTLAYLIQTNMWLEEYNVEVDI